MSITVQKQLVLEQAKRLQDSVDRTGEHLDGKASTVLQAGSLIISLISATTLPALVRGQPSFAVLIGLAGGFLAFIGMVVCAIFAWRPQDHKLVGPVTWDDLFDLYISKEVDDAYNQVLYDLSCAITANMAANERKARFVTLSTWLLVLQVVVILITALASAL